MTLECGCEVRKHGLPDNRTYSVSWCPLHAQAAETKAENDKLRAVIANDCETEEMARNVAKRVLPPNEVDGDEYGVPSLADIVDGLVAKVAELQLVVNDADLIFGAGWQESLKAVGGRPHEAVHAQLTKMVGTVTVLEKALAELLEHGVAAEWPEDAQVCWDKAVEQAERLLGR